MLAAHALGGYALAITDQQCDFTVLMHDLSPVIQNAFLDRQPAEKSQTTLLQALRAAIRTPAAEHPGQGPFWAISVLASIITLAGPALLRDAQFIILLKNLIQGGLQTGKKHVRNMTENLLGPLIWSWRKWRHSDHLQTAEDPQDLEDLEDAKSAFQKLLELMTKHAVGSVFVGSLMGPNHESCQRQDLLHAIYHTGEMANRGGYSTERALQILDRLVNAREDKAFYESWESKFLGRLNPPILFSAASGLLALEVGPTVMQAITNALPKVDDIRPLSQEERQMKVVWFRTRDAWLACLDQLSLPSDDPAPPTEVSDIWTGLVKMIFSNDKRERVCSLKLALVLTSRLSADGPNMQACSELCGSILATILADKTLDLREEGVGQDSASESTANQHLKLSVVSLLWSAAVEILPAQCSAFAARVLVKVLVQKYAELIQNGDECDDAMDLALSEWASLAASVDSFSTGEITLKYWNSWGLEERARARIWRAYARAWGENKNGSWKLAARLLGLPFRYCFVLARTFRCGLKVFQRNKSLGHVGCRYIRMEHAVDIYD